MSGESWVEAIANLRLEDSYVLGLAVTQGLVAVDLDAVLLESHPQYSPPLPGEAFCFRRGQMLFTGTDSVEWKMATARPAVDASGEVDWGGVDQFEVTQEGFAIAGDFGQLLVAGGAIELVLEPGPSS